MYPHLRFSNLIVALSLAVMLFTHNAVAVGSREKEDAMNDKQSALSSVPNVGLSNSQTEGFNQALSESKEFFLLTDGGDSLLAEGKIEEAIAEYKKAMGKSRLRPDALYVHDRLAKAYEHAECYEEALEEVREIARLWPHEETKDKVLKRLQVLEEKTKVQQNS